MVYRALFDGQLEIERPEMLIYAPVAGGSLQLAGVGYAVPFQFVPATARSLLLFGQDFKPCAQLDYWALHVWVWRKNSAGSFAEWNPAITCPATP